MIEAGKWRSNELANAYLARALETQAKSPVEAFGQIAQALLAKRSMQRTEAANNSRLAQLLRKREVGSGALAATTGSGSADRLLQAVLRVAHAQAADAPEENAERSVANALGYRRLPQGTVFRDPDGSLRRKL